MPVNVRVSDGTTTRQAQMVDARAEIVGTALCASLGLARPANTVDAIAAATQKWMRDTTRTHRLRLAARDAEATRDAAYALIEADEDAQP